MKSTFTDKFWQSFPFLFDPIQDFFNGNFYEVLNEKLLKHYKFNSVLELGCGVGSLLKHFKPDHYTGVDINQNFINVALTNFADNKNFTFITDDAFKFTSNQSFDLILGSSFSHHLTDSQFKQLMSYLKTQFKFKYLLIIDGKPTPSVWRPFLEAFDAGAQFRETSEVKKLVSTKFKVIKSGNLTANRPFYYFPYVLATSG